MSKNRKSKTPSPKTDADTLRLVHELQVHQIELEMQNDELVRSRTEAEEAYRQYTDLYDFAPVGYLTLAHDGTIREINLAGANLLGVEHNKLIRRRMEVFVSTESLPAFNVFFEKLLSGTGKETCELEFVKRGKELFWVRLEATCFEGGQECRIIMADITERKRMEEALRESEDRYRGFFDSEVNYCYQISSNGIILDLNPSALRVLGYASKGEIVGKPLLKTVYAPASQDRARQLLLLWKETGELRDEELTIITKNGEERTVILNVSAVKDAEGKILHSLSIQNDITERKRMEEVLRESEDKFKYIFDNSIVGNSITLLTGEMNANQSLCDMFGYTQAELRSKKWREITHPDDVELTQSEIDQLLSGEQNSARFSKRFIHKNGSVVWVDLLSSLRRDKDGKPLYLMSSVINITERKQAEDELRRAKEMLTTVNIDLQTALAREKQLAHTDVLTGVNNRRRLFELAEHEFEIAVRYQHPLSVMMFDIDHFKQVNDTYGHAAGDQILQRVTEVACAELRSADVIGRYGGEEFLIVLPMTNAGQAYPLAERIRAAVAAIRVPTEKGDAVVTLSIGIVEIVHGVQTRSVEALIRYADEAMYLAKQAGRNRTEIGDGK